MTSHPINITYKPPLTPYLTVVYRDDDFLVLDKPSGLLSVPARDPALSDSLATRVRRQFPQAEMINRLDMDTSGLILMSLNKPAHAAISRQFENRTTQKLYSAIVWGHMQDDAGMIDQPLAGDAENKPRHRVDPIHGRPSQTKWEVVERLAQTPAATRLRLIPLTGRTHQLRVHMKFIGHPILGDSFYADGEALAAAPRLMLHAEYLGFTHPDGRDVSFTVPCPF
ncbi:MAG: RluA family pseudouridine synthase [Bdellovibrionales bacterium]|jgi:tRNA pseudouridine32 synthase/23S rRNA pseudouridine746 synthase|nr:RluA family pseudouridine synthase [Bdellovibrionales bacterium]